MPNDVTEEDAERLERTSFVLYQLAQYTTQRPVEGVGVLAAALCAMAASNGYALDDVIGVIRCRYAVEENVVVTAAVDASGVRA